MLWLPLGHGHQDVSSAPRAARFASCPWLESICYRRRTRALKPAAATRIRGSRSSGLAARPRSRRCSECCDSIHPPAGHIYQCVPSLERAGHLHQGPAAGKMDIAAAPAAGLPAQTAETAPPPNHNKKTNPRFSDSLNTTYHPVIPHFQPH